jgi:hypothetical protein
MLHGGMFAMYRKHCRQRYDNEELIDPTDLTPACSCLAKNRCYFLILFE